MDFWEAFWAALLSSALTLLVGWIVYWRSTRAEWRAARVDAYAGYTAAVSDLSALGAVSYLAAQTASNGDPRSTPRAGVAVDAAPKEALQSAYAELAKSLHMVLLVGTPRAAAKAGLVNIALNNHVLPLLLTGGTPMDWRQAQSEVSTVQSEFVDSVRRERFKLW